MERLRFLQRAHGEGLITTEEYQLHKQRVLHFCSARHGNTLSCMDSGCQFDGTASAVHNGQTVKSTASPHTASAARVEQLTPLVDALNRLASLLEAHLHALPPPDDGLSGPGNQPCNESDLSSTMIIIPTQQADSAQYERAVLESESSRSGIVSGSSRPLSSPAAAPDSTVGISTDSLDTAPTEKNNKRAGRRFAFDRHGKSAISSDDTDVPTVPIDPLQVDVLKLMLDTITPEAAAVMGGSSSSTEEYEPQDRIQPVPHAPAEGAGVGHVRDTPVPRQRAMSGAGAGYHGQYHGGYIDPQRLQRYAPGAGAHGVGLKPAGRSPACFRNGGGPAAAHPPTTQPPHNIEAWAPPGRMFVQMPSAARLATAQEVRRKGLR